MERPTGFDIVQRPKHYNAHPSGVECIEIIEHMTLNLGNAVKYLWRGGLKITDDPTQEYQKALWYVRREAERQPFLPPAGRDLDTFRSAMSIDNRAKRALARPSPWCEPIRYSISLLIDAHCVDSVLEIERLNRRAQQCIGTAIADQRCLGRGMEP